MTNPQAPDPEPAPICGATVKITEATIDNGLLTVQWEATIDGAFGDSYCFVTFKDSAGTTIGNKVKIPITIKMFPRPSVNMEESCNVPDGTASINIEAFVVCFVEYMEHGKKSDRKELVAM